MELKGLDAISPGENDWNGLRYLEPSLPDLFTLNAYGSVVGESVAKNSALRVYVTLLRDWR
jgi:hypothetical protein